MSCSYRTPEMSVHRNISRHLYFLKIIQKKKMTRKQLYFWKHLMTSENFLLYIVRYEIFHSPGIYVRFIFQRL